MIYPVSIVYVPKEDGRKYCLKMVVQISYLSRYYV